MRQSNTHQTHGSSDQLVVPTGCRQAVIRLAHEGLMAGHQGITCTHTYERVRSKFYWPGFHEDVVRFCRSCDICQRTLPKGKVTQVPLGRMPLIDTPFKRIAMDLVGPIYPPSDRGHRYIVTIVDYATRYPEAAALKNIDMESVAEAVISLCYRQMYVACPIVQPGNSLNGLEQCISHIQNWMSSNLLKLNDGKTEVMVFASKRIPLPLDPVNR